MKGFLGTTLVAVTCLLFGGQRVGAQVGGLQRPGIGQTTTPAYSPYLNLFRPGSFYQNYYGLVRPEQEFRSDVQGLQGQITTNDQAIGGLQAGTGLLVTGHSTRFLNTGRYFLNSGGAQGAGRGAGRQSQQLQPTSQSASQSASSATQLPMR